MDSELECNSDHSCWFHFAKLVKKVKCSDINMANYSDTVLFILPLALSISNYKNTVCLCTFNFPPHKISSSDHTFTYMFNNYNQNENIHFPV